MKAAGAREHRARRFNGPVELAVPAGRLARIGTILVLVLALAILGCAAIGVAKTRLSDSQRRAAQHAALQAALGELQTVLGDVQPVDAAQVAIIAQRSDLHDLRFDSALMTEHGREIQSLHDGHGRIVGWFSWAPDRTFIRTMNWLWSFLAAIGLMLALAAFVTVRATRRVTAALARSRDTVRKLLTQDLLTGLPNRRVMLARLDETTTARGARRVTFALVAIEGFHEITDVLGHSGGEGLLRAIAERLKSALPPGAVLGRFNDNGFAVIACSDDAQIAARLGDALAASLAKPIFLDQMWQISAGIGIAQAPEDGINGDQLQRHATLAVRSAKRAGRGSVRRFVPQIRQEHTERRFFLRELATAVEEEAFDLHYQPLVSADGAGIVGVEALLRWNHPTRGAIAPSTFIPLAEENGLMIKLGKIAFRRALSDAARWPNLFVSINLSPVQMRSPSLVDRVAARLAEAGIDASRLVFEVTEGVLIDNPEETQRKFEALRALGVSMALDDFGTGYSSLSYLQKFPFDRLKIDRTFVSSLGTTGNTGAIIQSIVTLGHALGMKVVAEGVETNEQRVLLRLAGCDEMQGFLFARACPADAIDRLLAGPKPAARSSPVS